MAFTPPAATVFRDYATNGVPASGPHAPVPSEIRSLFDNIETEIDAAYARGTEGIDAAVARGLLPGVYMVWASLLAPVGWVAPGTYIGGAASGLTTPHRANEDCRNLFVILHVNTSLQLKNNAGSNVSRSGSGVSFANADFNAGCRIQLPEIDAGIIPSSPVLNWYVRL